MTKNMYWFMFLWYDLALSNVTTKEYGREYPVIS